MSEMAKKARAALKEKAKRLGSDRPTKKVDSSTFTPPELLDADVKTGLRPLSRRAYKSGGKVQGECAPMRADRKQRKAGGKVESPASYANAKINRNVKSANEEREGIKHVGGMKTGGRAKKEHGGGLYEGNRRVVSPTAYKAVEYNKKSDYRANEKPKDEPKDEGMTAEEAEAFMKSRKSGGRAKKNLGGMLKYLSPIAMLASLGDDDDKEKKARGGRAAKLSGGALARYAKKAARRGDIAARMAEGDSSGEVAKYANKRQAGVQMALNKIQNKFGDDKQDGSVSMNKGGRAKKQGGGLAGDPRTGGQAMLDNSAMAAGVPKELLAFAPSLPAGGMKRFLGLKKGGKAVAKSESYDALRAKGGTQVMGSYKKGGSAKHPDEAMDKALIKKMVKPSARMGKQKGGDVFSGKGYPGKVPGVTGGRKAKADGGTLPATQTATSPANTATGSMAAAGGNSAMNSSGTMNAAMGAKRSMQGQGVGDQVARMTARNTMVAANRPHKAARLEAMNAALASADPTKKGIEAARRGVSDSFGPSKNVREANVKGERSGRGPGRRGRKGKTAVTPATEAPAEKTTTTETVADTGPKMKRSPRYGSAAMVAAKKGGRIKKYAGGALGYAEGGSPAGAALPMPSRGGNPMRGGQNRGQNRGPQGGPGQRPQTGGPGATYQPAGSGGPGAPLPPGYPQPQTYPMMPQMRSGGDYGLPPQFPQTGGGYPLPQTQIDYSNPNTAGVGIPPEMMQRFMSLNQQPMQPQVMPGIQMGLGAMGGSPIDYRNVGLAAPQAMFNTGGRVGYKKGGKAKAAKGKTNINIVIAGNPKQPDPMADMQAPMPPMPPQGGPPMPPPMGGAPGMPPMPPAPPQGGPGPFKKGGRVYRSYKDMDAGAGSGLGRLEKTEIESRSGRKAGGKVYRSYKDMDAGAGSGLGRLEKTEIQRRK